MNREKLTNEWIASQASASEAEQIIRVVGVICHCLTHGNALLTKALGVKAAPPQKPVIDLFHLSYVVSSPELLDETKKYGQKSMDDAAIETCRQFIEKQRLAAQPPTS